jgi:hypothetical protein
VCGYGTEKRCARPTSWAKDAGGYKHFGMPWAVVVIGDKAGVLCTAPAAGGDGDGGDGDGGDLFRLDAGLGSPAADELLAGHLVRCSSHYRRQALRASRSCVLLRLRLRLRTYICPSM